MNKINLSDPGIITLSIHTYRLLLAFYPTRFRHSYGSHMAQVFRDCCLKTYRQSGLPGMLVLWVFTFFDWFKTVIEEQLHRETEMTRVKFIRLSGWGLILGAVTIALALLADAGTIQLGMYRLLGLPTTAEEYNAYRTFSEEVGTWLILPGALLLFAGAVGLRLRYGQQVGALGRVSLLVSMGGSGVIVLFFVIARFLAWEGWWYMLMLGMAFLFGGLAGFGIATLQTKPMPRWNGLPILAGVWFPLFILIGMGLDLTAPGNSGWQSPDALMNGILLITVISLILLGYVLQSDVPQEEAAS